MATQSALAMNQKKPSSCPTVNALASVGVNYAEYEKSQEDPRTGAWVAFQLNNNYSTDAEWSFYILPFRADSASDALANANAAIPRLAIWGFGEPVENHSGDGWDCLYSTDDAGIMALAQTPARNPDEISIASRYKMAMHH